MINMNSAQVIAFQKYLDESKEGFELFNFNLNVKNLSERKKERKNE